MPASSADGVIDPRSRAPDGARLSVLIPYTGFWEPIDTIMDKQRLDAFAETGRAPWQQPRLVPEPEFK